MNLGCLGHADMKSHYRHKLKEKEKEAGRQKQKRIKDKDYELEPDLSWVDIVQNLVKKSGNKEMYIKRRKNLFRQVLMIRNDSHKNKFKG